MPPQNKKKVSSRFVEELEIGKYQPISKSSKLKNILLCERLQISSVIGKKYKITSKSSSVYLFETNDEKKEICFNKKCPKELKSRFKELKKKFHDEEKQRQEESIQKEKDQEERALTEFNKNNKFQDVLYESDSDKEDIQTSFLNEMKEMPSDTSSTTFVTSSPISSITAEQNTKGREQFSGGNLLELEKKYKKLQSEFDVLKNIVLYKSNDNSINRSYTYFPLTKRTENWDKIYKHLFMKEFSKNVDKNEKVYEITTSIKYYLEMKKISARDVIIIKREMLLFKLWLVLLNVIFAEKKYLPLSFRFIDLHSVLLKTKLDTVKEEEYLTNPEVDALIKDYLNKIDEQNKGMFRTRRARYCAIEKEALEKL